LAVWREICSYWCFGVWLSIFNYMSLLYALLAGALIFLLIGFYEAAQDPMDVAEMPEAKDLWSVGWLKSFVLVSPIIVCVTIALTWLLTESHMFEIHKRLAVRKHDRAIQLIAMPAVFAVMSLAAICPILELLTGRISLEMLKSPWYDFKHPLTAQRHLATSSLLGLGSQASPQQSAQHGEKFWSQAWELAQWRHETCFYVADLFMAWAVFQFGRLVLERVNESLSEDSGMVFGDDEEASASSDDASKLRGDLIESHRAVISLTWVGTTLFVALCLLQSALSFWPYFGGDRAEEEPIMFHLRVAGVVSSCAAIYNLTVVERAFRRHLVPLSPALKFFGVQVLVSLSFLQHGLLDVLRSKLLPDPVRRILSVVPLLGDILSFSDLQLHLFYPALMIFECFFLAIAHLFIWRSNEKWYHECPASEVSPLVPKLRCPPPATTKEAKEEVKA